MGSNNRQCSLRQNNEGAAREGTSLEDSIRKLFNYIMIITINFILYIYIIYSLFLTCKQVITYYNLKIFIVTWKVYKKQNYYINYFSYK